MKNRSARSKDVVFVEYKKTYKCANHALYTVTELL